MPYHVIEDFRLGLDRRRNIASSPQGSLQTLTNAHISRGGEIEKRHAWVPVATFPAGKTIGLAGAGGRLYTFGSDTVVDMPSGFQYQQITHPNGRALAELVDSTFFDGKPWVVARFSDGSSHCFYDGARIVEGFEGRTPRSVLTAKKKIYAVYSSILAFSGVEEPIKFQDVAGAGIINMSNESAGSEQLTGLGRYQNNLAIFARRNTQVWFIDPDPLQNAVRQILPEIGTFAARSIASYGDADVFFLSDTGIRSLRARDSSNQAGVDDIGTAIDTEVQDYLRTLTETEREQAVSAIDPVDGRYILAVGRRAYVFSYFPKARVSAWSQYDLGTQFTDMVSMDGKLWARAGDTVFLFGGATGVEYDSSAVVVETPYIDGKQIASFKQFTGFDIVCEGQWSVYVNTDIDNPAAETLIATVTGSSITNEGIAFDAASPVAKFRLVNERPGRASISRLILHYTATRQT